jgi:dTDP-4-dehydrorhamnose reductase
MKILITGANGQLAKEFQQMLKEYNYEVTALDREKLDISLSDRVKETFAQYAPDIVLNCAAYNFVDNAETDFESAYAVNALGVKNLALMCRQHKVLFIHFSSDYIFDGLKENFYAEDDKPNPVNSYGKTKLAGETFLQEESDNFLLFRVSWVFGEGKQNFLYKLLEWAKKNKTLKIVYDQISVPTFTKDIVTLTMLAVSKRMRGVYHLTNSGYASRYEVARYFFERMGLDNLVLPVGSGYFPVPARRPFFSAMSNLKLSGELNIAIPDWKLGIDRYVESLFEKEKI